MSRNPSISIIIPVTSTYQPVRKAIASLLDQSFRSFEILLVVFPGTTPCVDLCEQFANEDMRIRILYQEEFSLAKARNTALGVARGTYLFFMNDNDWCELNLLESLFQAASDGNLDLLIAGYTIDTYLNDQGGSYRTTYNAPNYNYASSKEFHADAQNLLMNRLVYALWNKLYRRSYITERNLRFADDSKSALVFNLDVMRNIEQVGCLNNHAYHFSSSCENNQYPSWDCSYADLEKEYQQIANLFDYWNMNTPEVREFLACRYSERLVAYLENITSHNCVLSPDEKLAAVHEMISTPLARKALELAKPRSKTMGITLASLRKDNIKLAMAQRSIIARIRHNGTTLFAHLRANR